MASLLIKRVASNLIRVRSSATPARFFNTMAFQYVKRDSEYDCILKCRDDKHQSSVNHVVNLVFNPRVSPSRNLFRLLNFTDVMIIGFKFLPQIPRWNVLEDDKALYLLRGMPDMHKEFMPEIRQNDFKESVPQCEFMFAIHPDDDVKECSREMTLSSLLHLMRGVKSEPSEYYYHVMQDAEELNNFFERASGTTHADSLSYTVSYKLQNPQAIRIMIGICGKDNEGRETDDPFQGFAIEIFLPERIYNIQDAKSDKTGSIWKIMIPKKKGELTQTIGGNLLFFHETRKPTLWHRIISLLLHVI